MRYFEGFSVHIPTYFFVRCDGGFVSKISMYGNGKWEIFGILREKRPLTQEITVSRGGKWSLARQSPLFPPSGNTRRCFL